jgi:tetratricopeptide (TPR) repeat protein
MKALLTLVLFTAFGLFLSLKPGAAQASPSFRDLAERAAAATEFEEAIQLSQQLLELAERSGETQELAEAYGHLARSYFRWADAEQTLQYAEMGLELLDELQLPTGIVQSLRQDRAWALSRMGRTQEALTEGGEAYEIALDLESPETLLRSTQFLANLHGRIGNHSESLRYHLESLASFGMEDTLRRLQILNNVILVLVRMGSLDRAMVYSNQAEDLRRGVRESTPAVVHTSAILLLNRGNILRIQGKYEEQLLVLEEADELLRQSSDVQARALITGALADAHLNLGNFDRAAEYSRRALTETDPVETPYPHGIALANLGLALSRSGQDAAGIGNLLEAREMLTRIEATAEALEVQGLIAEAYQAAGNHAAAATEFKRFKEETDDFRREQTETRLSEAQAEFDVSLADKEVELLEAERQVQELVISQQRYLVISSIIGLVGAFVVIGLGWARYRLKTEAYEALAMAHGKLDKALAEVKVLQELLPICSKCKNIRDDQGLWSRVETYISSHTDTQFSHTLCPECVRELYPELVDELDLEEAEG